MNLPLVSRKCIKCGVVLLTRAGNRKWCSICRDAEYTATQKQSQRRYLAKLKRRKSK